jgi:hypothetical protein
MAMKACIDCGAPAAPRSGAGAGVWRRLTCGVMRAPKKKPTAAKLRPWRVLLMRARAQQLGIVYAPDEKSAEAAAIAEFKIGDDQRHRLDRARE